MKRFVFSSQHTKNPHAPRSPRPTPPASDMTSPRTGLRAIAVLEASKGVLVLLAGVSLLSLLDRDAGVMAVHLVRGLRLSPDHRYSLLFLQAASQVTDAQLQTLAGGATAYAMVRFIEAYGLWQQRAWAEWLALLSAGIYLPWELYEVVRRATLGAEVILLLNTIIVLYLLSCRLAAWRTRREPVSLALAESD